MANMWHDRPSSAQILGFRPMAIERRTEPQPAFVGVRLAVGMLVIGGAVLAVVAWVTQ